MFDYNIKARITLIYYCKTFPLYKKKRALPGSTTVDMTRFFSYVIILQRL